ncbi:head-tail connector protein [Methylomonas sp. MED-D]|uniref:head-tail connector protein n=1 Tax=Methylomonas sp. MED-D TaxID=3418768 RepID=UPI003D050A64
MIHTIKTAPAVEPLTLAEMRQYLGIGDPTAIDRDAVITARVKTARKIVENYTGRALINQTWQAVGEDFGDVIMLVAPLVSVTSIKYTDSNGTQQTLAGSEYYVQTKNARIVTAYGKTWPTVRSDVEPVIVEYVAGYGADGDAVPGALKEAIALLVSVWEQFQSSQAGLGYPPDLPNACRTLMNPYNDYRNIARSNG